MQTQYQVNQFTSLLESLHQQKINGTLEVTANLGTGMAAQSRIFVFYNGEIVFAGDSIPDNVSFVISLAKKLGRSLIETAVGFALPKLTDKQSTRELLETLVRIRVIQWAEIETVLRDRVAQIIEQLLPYAGAYHLDEKVTFDLTLAESNRGLDWPHLRHELEHRQKTWRSLTQIPSVDAIPHLKEDSLLTHLDLTVRYKLQQQVDGKRSLREIAENLDQDPLKLGQSYVLSGWITFSPSQGNTNSKPPAASVPVSTPVLTPISTPVSTPVETSKRPLILSVDDSPIVQTTIKRILKDRYEVMLANNATDALNLLNTNPVEVLLLDVTMPDIDGLKFCKTLRGIPKFKNLPIIMLTAKDNIIDKCQGFIAGSNQYLYKPVEPEKLLAIIDSYIQA
ncbi:response regulator [Tumidithrix elongata RA019]|uniref:Response regulator n=1 Tax=Tumidithrix elongata BACA0141 TaxID=2716417 RepID=A0AAW9PS19_9CYAN|nr:response regulator [Tumidithrix elongata RA019]